MKFEIVPRSMGATGIGRTLHAGVVYDTDEFKVGVINELMQKRPDQFIIKVEKEVPAEKEVPVVTAPVIAPEEAAEIVDESKVGKRSVKGKRG